MVHQAHPYGDYSNPEHAREEGLDPRGWVVISLRLNPSYGPALLTATERRYLVWIREELARRAAAGDGTRTDGSGDR